MNDPILNSLLRSLVEKGRNDEELFGLILDRLEEMGDPRLEGSRRLLRKFAEINPLSTKELRLKIVSKARSMFIEQADKHLSQWQLSSSNNALLHQYADMIIKNQSRKRKYVLYSIESSLQELFSLLEDAWLTLQLEHDDNRYKNLVIFLECSHLLYPSLFSEGATKE